MQKNLSKIMKKKPIERYRIGLELLGSAKGLKVLDAGCGFGTIEQFIDAIGIDQNSYNIEQAKSQLPNKDFRVGTLEDLPFPDDSFDAVIMLETLEHLQNEEDSLKEISRICKPGAKLILSVPNDRLLYKIIDLEYWLIPFLTKRPRHRHYNKNVLKHKLKENGFYVKIIFERGLIFSAMSRWFIFCFDMIDRIFFGGFNGPAGKCARKLINPLIDLEFRIPTPYGHSVFLSAKKET